MEKSTGLQRIGNATKYSLKGFKSAIKYETAFRQELILLLVAYIIVMLIDFVMIVELLNSAIECVVDRIGSERHELSGRAKDYGSAAVFMSLLLTVILWIYLFSCHFFS